MTALSHTSFTQDNEPAIHPTPWCNGKKIPRILFSSTHNLMCLIDKVLYDKGMYLASLIKENRLWLSYLTFQIVTFLVCFWICLSPHSAFAPQRAGRPNLEFGSICQTNPILLLLSLPAQASLLLQSSHCNTCNYGCLHKDKCSLSVESSELILQTTPGRPFLLKSVGTSRLQCRKLHQAIDNWQKFDNEYNKPDVFP